MARKLDSATTKKIKTTPKTAKKIGRKIDQIAGVKFNSPEDRQLAEIEMWLSPFEVGGLIDHPLLRLLNESTTDFEKFKKVSKDQNLLIVWQHLKHVEKFEPESKYKNAYKEWSWNNKITSDITDKIKLQILSFMKETATVSSSETGLPNWFTSVSSVADVFGSSSQQDSKIFYPNYYCTTDISTRMLAGKITHILSPRTYYDAGLNIKNCLFNGTRRSKKYGEDLRFVPW